MNKFTCAVFAGALMALCGCRGPASGTVAVPDPGPAQRQEAYKLVVQAEAAWKTGKTDRAIELYEKSLELSRDFMVVPNNLGELYRQKGDRLRAVMYFQDAADLDPTDPRPCYNIACIYHEAENPAKALDYFKQSLARHQQYLPSLRGMAQVGRRLVIADDDILSMMNLALLIEKDPAWRKIFQEEKYRIEGALQAAGRTGKF